MAKKVAPRKPKRKTPSRVTKAVSRKSAEPKTRRSKPAISPQKSAATLVRQAVDESSGILRLAPNWVPRSFLVPGHRLKLAPGDLYALGTDRGGIDERWLASTTTAANPGAPADEGLSYIVHKGEKICTLREVVALEGPRLVGQEIWDRYQRWPVLSKLFDNMGPIPLHMHQNNSQAAQVGQQGKPEAYYFPPQLNSTANHFPYTFFGLEPGTTKSDIRRCLERWNEGDNGVLDFSRAYHLKPGTGWLVPAGILHAPGSLVTYEPQWGSDVFSVYQSMIEGRGVPRELLVKDVPPDRQHDNEYLVEQLDWEANVDPQFKDRHYLEPIAVAETSANGYLDRWVVYGRFAGQELFSAKELTVHPGVRVTIKDNGAYGLIAVQGSGWLGKHRLQTPAMIGFGQLTEDEVFVSHDAARQGVVFDNTGSEPLVTLRYFGPDTNPAAPGVGAHKR
jgi:hypothetical protein